MWLLCLVLFSCTTLGSSLFELASWTTCSHKKFKFTQKFFSVEHLFPPQMIEQIERIIYHDDAVMFKICPNLEDSWKEDPQNELNEMIGSLVEDKSIHFVESEERRSVERNKRISREDDQLKLSFRFMNLLQKKLQKKRHFEQVREMLLVALEYISCIVLEFFRACVVKGSPLQL